MFNSNVFSNLRARMPTNLQNLGSKSLSSSLGSALAWLSNLALESANSCSAFAASFADCWDSIPDMLLDPEVTINVLERFPVVGSQVVQSLDDVMAAYGSGPVTIGDATYLNSITLSDADGNVIKVLSDGVGNIYAWDGFTESPVEVIHTQVNRNTENTVDIASFWPVCKSSSEEQTQYSSIADISAGLMENASINELLHGTCTTIMSSSDEDMGAALLSLRDDMSSQWDSVKSLAADVYGSFRSGGVYGVVRYVISLAQNPASVGVENGRLTFTDNNAYVPQAYIAGIVNSVSTVITTIASAIVAIWQPVVGLLVSALSQTVMSIFGAVNYSITVDEKAKWTDSYRAVGSLAPLSVNQAVVQLSTSEFNNLKSNFSSLEIGGVVLIAVPGGHIIHYINESGEASYEFHPDVIDRRAWLYDNRIIYPWVDGNTHHCEVDISYSMSILLKMYKNRRKCIKSGGIYGYNATDDLDESILYDFNTFVPKVPVEGNKVLDDNDSYELADIVTCNLVLFFVYLQSGLHTPTVIDFRGVLQESGFAQSVYIYNILTETSRIMGTISGGGDDSRATLFFMNASLLWHEKYYTTGKNWSAAEQVLPGKGIYYNLGKLAVHWNQQYAPTAPVEAWQATGYVINDNTSQALCPVRVRFPYQELVAVSSGGQENNPLPGSADVVLPVNNNIEFVFESPKIQRGSTINAVIMMAIAAALTIAVVVTTKLVASRKLAIKRTQLKARAEKAWARCCDDPSTQNVKAYRKAVRKNNMFATVFGGTKLGKSGYWDSPSGSDGDSVTTRVSSLFTESEPPSSLSRVEFLLTGIPDEDLD